MLGKSSMIVHDHRRRRVKLSAAMLMVLLTGCGGVAGSPQAGASPTQLPAVVETAPLGITMAEAVAIARDAAPQAETYQVVAARAGPYKVIGDIFVNVDLAGDRWVWLITFSDGGPPLGAEGTFVLVDYIDGTVHAIQDWIS